MTARPFFRSAAPALCLALGCLSPHPLTAAKMELKTAKMLSEGARVKIACFGDSITGVYYNTGGHRGWCDLLGMTLAELYPAASVDMINAGVSGNTTADGLKRMEVDVLSQKPDLVVVMFGINDVGKGVSPDAFRANLKEIVRRSRSLGADVILMTPNPIFSDDPTRPPWRVENYAGIVREVGRELELPVSDGYAAFDKVRTIDRPAWTRLMNDTLHPNLRGHRIFAEEVALTISGIRHPLGELPKPNPALPILLRRLQENEAVKIVAMKPYDELIAPAIRSLFPGARLEITAWDPRGKSLVEIEEQAKAIGWWKYRMNGSERRPDLVLLAVPVDSLAPSDEEFFHSYTWIISWSLSFGKPEWDCLAILPSAGSAALDPGERAAEALGREVVEGQDVPFIERTSGDGTSPSDLLARQLRVLLGLH